MQFIRLLIFFMIVRSIQSNLFPLFLQDFLYHSGKYQRVVEFSCDRKSSLMFQKQFVGSLHPIRSAINYKNLVSDPFAIHKTFFVVDLLCDESTELLKKAEEEKLFKAPFKWIFYHNLNKTNESTIKQYFGKFQVLPDSDVTLAINQNNSIHLIQFYKINSNFSYIIEEFGNWTNASGLNRILLEPTPSRRKNVQQMTMVSAMIYTDNYTIDHLLDYTKIQVDLIPRVSYTLWHILSSFMNFSLKVTFNQKSFGYYSNKTGWTGVVGELVRHEADMGGCAGYIINNRIEIIQYMPFPLPAIAKFFFRQPKLSHVTNIYILPFRRSVWLSTFALIFLFTLFLYSVLKWEQKRRMNRSTPPHTLLDSFFVIIGVVCQEAIPHIPIGGPGRMVSFTLLIAFLLLFTSYTANVVSLLQAPSASIRTIGDLLESGLEVGVHEASYNKFYFPKVTDPVKKALYSRKIAPPGKPAHYFNLETGIRRMRDEYFAFFCGRSAAYTEIAETFREDQKCAIQDIDYLQMQYAFLIIQKNSSYKEIIATGLLRMVERGLLSREFTKRDANKPGCTSGTYEFVNIGLIDCYFGCMILITGMALAIFALLLEIYVHYRMSQRTQQNPLFTSHENFAFKQY